MKKNLYKILLMLLSVSPILTLAANVSLDGGSNSFDSLQSVMASLIAIIKDYVIPLIFAFAILIFLWGVLKYIRSGGDPKARGEGSSFMLYGIVALAVMISVWGLVKILTGTIGITEVVLPGVTPTE